MMSWQNQITEGISTAAQLAAAIGLTPEKDAEIARITERYPMMITPYYLSLVDRNDPDDPIARMCIPSMAEFGEGGSFDTSGESSNTKMDGLQHKYKPTVLLLSALQKDGRDVSLEALTGESCAEGICRALGA